MATSSKVQFNLETLKEQALESIDYRIAQTQKQVEAFYDEQVLEQLIQEWRDRQESKISELFSSLDTINNPKLADFKIDPIPEIDRYDQRRAERRLDHLQAERSQIIAKAESLVADEQGNISLTRTQLSEFFAL